MHFYYTSSTLINETEYDLNQVIAHIYYIQKGARANQVSAHIYYIQKNNGLLLQSIHNHHFIILNMSLHQSVEQVSPVAFSYSTIVIPHSCHSSP
jgi:hypothetical protein